MTNGPARQQQQGAAKTDLPVEPLSPVAEALARQAAMRPARGGVKRVGPIDVVPKVKRGRKNRRRIPK
jgi:hypothetical protein